MIKRYWPELVLAVFEVLALGTFVIAVGTWTDYLTHLR